MNTLAIRHQGRGIDCIPLDEHTFRIRIACAKGDFDRVELCYCLIFILHRGRRYFSEEGLSKTYDFAMPTLFLFSVSVYQFLRYASRGILGRYGGDVSDFFSSVLQGACG